MITSLGYVKERGRHLSARPPINLQTPSENRHNLRPEVQEIFRLSMFVF